MSSINVARHPIKQCDRSQASGSGWPGWRQVLST